MRAIKNPVTGLYSYLYDDYEDYDDYGSVHPNTTNTVEKKRKAVKIKKSDSESVTSIAKRRAKKASGKSRLIIRFKRSL